MVSIRISTAFVAAILGVVAIAPKASADPYDKKIIATFADSIALPGGVTLQPGTYVFKLQDSSNDRHIVLIQNQRENHTYAQVFATNSFRVVPKGKVQFIYWETAAGQPKAIREVFWPGDNHGQAFEYSREELSRLDQPQSNTQTAAVTPAPASQPVAPAAEPAPAPQQPVETAQNTPPPAPEPAPAVTTPEPAPSPAPEQAPAPVVAENSRPATLPQTASTLPLLALIGLISIAFSFVLDAFVKRMG